MKKGGFIAENNSILECKNVLIIWKCFDYYQSMVRFTFKVRSYFGLPWCLCISIISVYISWIRYRFQMVQNTIIWLQLPIFRLHTKCDGKISNRKNGEQWMTVWESNARLCFDVTASTERQQIVSVNHYKLKCKLARQKERGVRNRFHFINLKKNLYQLLWRACDNTRFVGFWSVELPQWENIRDVHTRHDNSPNIRFAEIWETVWFEKRCDYECNAIQFIYLFL